MFGLFRRILEAVTPQQQKRQEAAKTTNDQGIRDAARRIEKIKRLVINLCVYGGDDSEAKHLLSSVEGDSIKREILEEHPRLALHALITRRPPERR
jgi:hypothetical protein